LQDGKFKGSLWRIPRGRWLEYDGWSIEISPGFGLRKSHILASGSVVRIPQGRHATCKYGNQELTRFALCYHRTVCQLQGRRDISRLTGGCHVGSLTSGVPSLTSKVPSVNPGSPTRPLSYPNVSLPILLVSMSTDYSNRIYVYRLLYPAIYAILRCSDVPKPSGCESLF
jgi:hypothetical protein